MFELFPACSVSHVVLQGVLYSPLSTLWHLLVTPLSNYSSVTVLGTPVAQLYSFSRFPASRPAWYWIVLNLEVMLQRSSLLSEIWFQEYFLSWAQTILTASFAPGTKAKIYVWILEWVLENQITTRMWFRIEVRLICTKVAHFM